ncbi:hypothetical protein C5167_013542 [Papaver somniferum]|uniref:X8 domain-containing protein n=1 Tax=Papaver somniferum TaxID=3469 RepID=A0A4Y7J4U8_PAPSO|nr:glucan endo-1,3-beta-glucosidase 12-like [Papaver somniferum]RZC54685.1 hypothetical protein C5167_013542 [Papaver somniferum]
MLKFICCFALLYCSFSLGLTDAGQESFTILKLHDPKIPMVFQSVSGSGIPVAVSVSSEELKEISSSVLMAESWLRTHVLTHYPATKITTIVVTKNILCNKDHEKIWGLVLPSMKNIYHSLVRWGLEKQIKVTAGVSKACLHPLFNSYKDDISDSLIKPVLDFLYYSNSTYSVNPASDFSTLSEKTTKLVLESHRVSMKKLGFLDAIDMNVIYGPEEKKPIKRKLSSMSSSEVVDPFPARPTPMPIHSSIGYSVPAYVTKNPPSPSSMYPPSPVVTPALPLVASPPTPSMAPSPVSYSYTPPSPPVSYSYPPLMSSPPLPIVLPGPASPPSDYFTYPPCVHSPPADAAPTPISTTSPPPPGSSSVEKKLWCVAKPSVPADDLQEAIDYACGVGGADCDEIKPNGSCYNPDTVVAHASYAFNSYWQKNKNNGGTCSFGGTAMIISTDPSFLQCRFLVMD